MRIKHGLFVLVLVAGLLASPVAVQADDGDLITYRFEGPVGFNGEDNAFLTGSVVFDPSVAPVDIIGEFDTGERVRYPGAALSLVFTVDGFTHDLMNGDIIVGNDVRRCIAKRVLPPPRVCLNWQDEPDTIRFHFKSSTPEGSEDLELIANAYNPEFLSSIVLPAQPPEGTERIDLFWDLIAGTEYQSIASNEIEWVREHETPVNVNDQVELARYHHTMTNTHLTITAKFSNTSTTCFNDVRFPLADSSWGRFDYEEVVATDAQLGGDGMLCPGETTEDIVFSVRHYGKRFGFYVDVYAVIAEMP